MTSDRSISMLEQIKKTLIKRIKDFICDNNAPIILNRLTRLQIEGGIDLLDINIHN